MRKTLSSVLGITKLKHDEDHCLDWVLHSKSTLFYLN